MQASKRTLIVGTVAVLLSTGARSHTDKAHAPPTGPAKKEQKAWGIAGEPKAVRRTIAVNMLDTMRFVPDRIVVTLGETVRFTATNTGTVMHEFVIGTKKENEAHAALMMKFPTMEHDEPHMAHVPPGKTGQIVWTFNRPGDFEFACLIAGHHSAGMVGTIQVAAGTSKKGGGRANRKSFPLERPVHAQQRPDGRLPRGRSA